MIPGVIPGIVVDAQASIRGAIRKGVAVDIVASTAGQFNMVQGSRHKRKFCSTPKVRLPPGKSRFLNEYLRL
jgi:hypothetical protein